MALVQGRVLHRLLRHVKAPTDLSERCCLMAMGVDVRTVAVNRGRICASSPLQAATFISNRPLHQHHGLSPSSLGHSQPNLPPDYFLGCQTVVSGSPSSSAGVYRCPARLLEQFSQLAILDGPPTVTVRYDCPVPRPALDIVAPDTVKSEVAEPVTSRNTAKEAKMIMRIRHKKMKKHKLRKLRKRMYFLWRKQKQTRKARRLAVYNQELDEIRQKGQTFNAEEFVRHQLVKARRGGFYINVFDSR